MERESLGKEEPPNALNTWTVLSEGEGGKKREGDEMKGKGRRTRVREKERRNEKEKG